ncbi:YcfL family protein [Vibrio sp. Of7-15]|uniref:YcfL family protein n=1 Tax=Vibrio sp. Of7-15 TaxID=2724879 RepID=UPI001EF1D963|nr:YcfL family protein [Vibrio sp. Of7-15]MCG7497095.1 YcfL family protein [Vibrio sp. Of7-15]
MKWLSALLLSVLLMGCSAHTTGISVDSDTQKVVFGDNVLGGRLMINKAGSHHINGLMQGIVSMTSRYAGDQNLQYRFYWYDGQGLEINGSDSPWRQLIVHGMDTVSVQEVALSPEATQYRIQIRQASN